MFAVMEKHGDVYSNIQPDPEFRLKDINRSIKHTFLDFGDDDFTNGKPHPMIDPTNRISRLTAKVEAMIEASKEDLAAAAS
ncbi:hypothetical protein RI705_32290, partial [Pseudomonas aeruginosa]|uniref:hypothetical protein n=1 Tax=Pseudomonas aeruginosa TaxID=287 RepID=UPI00301D6203